MLQSTPIWHSSTSVKRWGKKLSNLRVLPDQVVANIYSRYVPILPSETPVLIPFAGSGSEMEAAQEMRISTEW